MSFLNSKWHRSHGQWLRTYFHQGLLEMFLEFLQDLVLMTWRHKVITYRISKMIGAVQNNGPRHHVLLRFTATCQNTIFSKLLPKPKPYKRKKISAHLILAEKPSLSKRASCCWSIAILKLSMGDTVIHAPGPPSPLATNPGFTWRKETERRNESKRHS